MTRALRLELSAEGDTVEDLIAAIDDALRSFTSNAQAPPAAFTDATDITVESSPHPAAGWQWRWVEDLDAPSPSELAMEAHKAAGGAVRRRPPPSR